VNKKVIKTPALVSILLGVTTMQRKKTPLQDPSDVRCLLQSQFFPFCHRKQSMWGFALNTKAYFDLTLSMLHRLLSSLYSVWRDQCRKQSDIVWQLRVFVVGHHHWNIPTEKAC